MAINPMDEVFKLVKVIHPLVIRLSGGRVGGTVAGMPMIILTTIGRRSGKPRDTPLTVIEHDGRTYVVASKGGDDRHPAWYLNLVDTPEVSVRRGGRTKPMMARVLGAEEREAIWPVVTRTYKGYASYEKKTDRQIPVIELAPATSGGA